MTKYKIKLMFAFLNALLTAGIVDSRPMNNATDLINITNTTEDIEIPVIPNTDTLIVDNDSVEIGNTKPPQETIEQTNKNSKTSIDAIVNAEQGRDELILSKKNLKDAKVLEISKEETALLEKQLNVSSSHLEDIIDAEIGREETLTDHLFKPEAELVEVPYFQFLIDDKVNLSKPANFIGDFKPIKNISDGEDDLLKKVDYVELVAVVPPTLISQNLSVQLTNITGHEVDDDLAPDTRYTDLQTVFLASVVTLVPLIVTLLAALCIRSICRKYCRCRKKSVVSSESDSSEDKQDSSSHQQLKSIPEQSSEADEDEEEQPPANNGSIVTMTLKNNHLIVETEERNDIIYKNGRETKLKYSPDNEGIFIVEVQQAGVYRPPALVPGSPDHDPQISTNQALIHRVPDESDTSESRTFNEADESSDQSFRFEQARALALSSTGLSISDLSMTSVGSQIATYTYSNQTGYEQGPFGYPIYPGYDIPLDNTPNRIIHENSTEPLIAKTPTELTKPVVTSAIFKQDSIIGSDAFQGPGYCIEGSTDGPLLSDVQAREVSLLQLHDKKKMENGGLAGKCGDGISTAAGDKGFSPKNKQSDVISKTSDVFGKVTDPNGKISFAIGLNEDNKDTKVVVEEETTEFNNDIVDINGKKDAKDKENSQNNVTDEKTVEIENTTTNAPIRAPKLIRADTLPTHIDTKVIDKPNINKIDEIPELESLEEIISPKRQHLNKGKRPSLPIIRTEMYDTVKEIFVPIGSPQFEKFVRDMSPVDNGNQPPLITITEEIDVKTDNGNS